MTRKPETDRVAQEVGWPGKGGFGERAELEDQGRDPVAIAFQRPGELFVEKTVVQEALVRGARTRAVPGVAGPPRHCDFFRNLETELEGRRRLVEKLLPVRGGGELVEAEVAADHGECFGILPQAFGLKLLLRELPPFDVAVLAVDVPQPALVFPRGGAEKHVPLGQAVKFLGQPPGLGRSIFGVEKGQLSHRWSSRESG